MSLDITDWYNRLSTGCSCGHAHHGLTVDTFSIRNGALWELRSYLLEKGWRRVHLVADAHTNEAAGNELVRHLSEEVNVERTIVLPDQNGDVIADEQAIMQVITESSRETDIFIAAGAGTIHDITRFASHTVGKSFIAVPTAPSVDGFNSMGAPIVLRKKKITYQTQAPAALFADLDILRKAPRAMTAAGFADVLGKYISLADWSFGAVMAGEPYCPAAAKMTQEALDQAVSAKEEIHRGSSFGMEQLFEALLKSGMAMSLFGRSHPASGGEHHLSHYWEMAFLEEGRKQLLHGEKVGVAAGLIADVYHGEVLQKVFRDPALDTGQRKGIEALISQLPNGEEIRMMLKAAGGKTTLAELNIEPALYEQSKAHAHTLRDRKTMLHYLNTV